MNWSREQRRVVSWLAVACMPTVILFILDFAQTRGFPWRSLPSFLVQVAVLATFIFFMLRQKRSAWDLIRREAHGTVTRENYYLARAFVLPAAPGAAPAYYLQLDDGRILFLTGAYLSRHDGHSLLSPREFPCTDFAALRDTATGQILGLKCSGTYFPPAKLPTRPANLPADGTIITDRTIEEIQAAGV